MVLSQHEPLGEVILRRIGYCSGHTAVWVVWLMFPCPARCLTQNQSIRIYFATLTFYCIELGIAQKCVTKKEWELKTPKVSSPPPWEPCRGLRTYLVLQSRSQSLPLGNSDHLHSLWIHTGLGWAAERTEDFKVNRKEQQLHLKSHICELLHADSWHSRRLALFSTWRK